MLTYLLTLAHTTITLAYHSSYKRAMSTWGDLLPFKGESVTIESIECGAVFIDDAPPVFYWPELREDEGERKNMEELGLMILFDIDVS